MNGKQFSYYFFEQALNALSEGIAKDSIWAMGAALVKVLPNLDDESENLTINVSLEEFKNIYESMFDVALFNEPGVMEDVMG